MCIYFCPKCYITLPTKISKTPICPDCLTLGIIDNYPDKALEEFWIPYSQNHNNLLFEEELFFLDMYPDGDLDAFNLF